MGEIYKFKTETNLQVLIERYLSKNGYLGLSANGLLLHSRYDPVKEAEQWADKKYKKNHLHILFGLGAGYFAEKLLEKLGENDYLFVIEPSFSIFNEAINIANIKKFHSHGKVNIFVGYDIKELERQIRLFVNRQFAGRVEVICSPNYEKLFPGELSQLEKIVVEINKLELVNLNTIKNFARTWQENFLTNLFFAWQAIPFNRLIGKLDCPVVIASSGPSLNKQLADLKSVRDKVLIIAAGSTINPLLRGGVKPHLVVTIDGSLANYKHFEGLDIDDIPMFYAMIVHKDIPARHKGKKVVFNSDIQQLSDWADSVYGEPLGYVRGGPSVANFCFDLARQLSSGPICFIGQDLAYTDNKSHAEGNKYYKEVKVADKVDGKKYLFTKGFFGDQVITDYPFLNMKKQFEEQILSLRTFYKSTQKVYNATEGGVYIDGMEHISFKEFINEYCGQDITVQFNNLFEVDIDKNAVKKRIHESYYNEQANLDQANRLCKKALSLLNGVSRESEYVDTKILSKLDKIDQELNELLKTNLVHFALMPQIFRINHLFIEPENETVLERTKRILDKSEALYTAIQKTASYVLDIIINLREGL